ncbi:MAG: cupredoxin domain-containing protein [Candidatus Korobacteraceae bacterium]
MLKRTFYFLTALALAVASSFATPQQESSDRIEIVARRFSFTPAEITLTKGKPVTLVLSSEDATHGLSVPELSIKTEIPKGRKTEVAITPDKAGDFAGQCSYFCGTGHAEMQFTVHVQE